MGNNWKILKYALIVFVLPLLLVSCKSTENGNNGGFDSISYLKSDLAFDKESVWKFKGAITDTLSRKDFVCIAKTIGNEYVDETTCYKPIDMESTDHGFLIFRMQHILTDSKDMLSVQLFRGEDDPKRYGLNLVNVYSVTKQDINKYNPILTSMVDKYDGEEV